MALQSQAPRVQSRITSSKSGTAQPGLGAKIGVGVCFLLVVGLGGFAVVKMGMKSGQTAGETTSPLGPKSAQASTAVPAADATEKLAPKTPPAPVPSFEMGKTADSSTLVPAPSKPAPAAGSALSAMGSQGANPATENTTSPKATPSGPAPTTPQPSTGAPLSTSGASNVGGMGESGTPGEIRDMVDKASQAVAAGKPVEARAMLNKGLMDGRLSAEDRQALRAQIAALNETLFFGAGIAQGDPIADAYIIQSGDSLVKLTAKQGLPVDYRLIQRINGLSNPGALRVGQKIKVIRQPLHVIVHKHDYRMDVYAGEPIPAGGSIGRTTGPDGQDSTWTYIRSFPVGLGESNGTPEGAFVVRPKSKLINPRWVNPRTGEVFEADNPKNPIGEHWIGLEGVEESTKKFMGYGIHGTVDPDSIGKSMSMGCVRMKAEDVAIVWELLVDRISTVRIVP